MTKRFKAFVPEPGWAESLKALEQIATVEVGAPGTKYTEDLLRSKVQDVDALIITSQHSVTREILETASRLKVIAKYGSKPGPDNVDLQAATQKGVVVCYTPGANADSVAEHTIGLILALLKKMLVTASQLRQGVWRDLSSLGQELWGKTVGIIGLGTVGRKVAQKLAGFDVELLAHDPYVSSEEAQRVGATLVDLRTLLCTSDVITVHAILNQETRHLIGEDELRLCKDSAYIINTARGAIIDEAALIKALERGCIAGAALDAFTDEPPRPDNPLLKMDNVLATPHFASCTVDAYRKETAMAAREVLRVLNGKKPRFAANPEVLSHLDLD